MSGILFWRGLVEAVDVYQLVPVVRLKNSRVGQFTKVLGVKKKTNRFVGTRDRDTKVIRLTLTEDREVYFELSEMGTSDLFIQLLRKRVNTQRELFRSSPKSYLGQSLIGKRARHDERRMTSGTSDG